MNKQSNKVSKAATITIILLSVYLVVIFIQMARYDEDNFNCVDMTNECSGVLDTLHIPYETVVGYNDEYWPGTELRQGHRWLRIFGFDFECTCLTFMNMTKDWEYVYIK